MDLTNIEIDLFLGHGFNVYYPKHLPSGMVTFMSLMNLIQENRYREAFICFLLFNDVLPGYIV